MNDSDLVKELLIGTAAFTRFTFAEVVISGAGDAQSLAKFSDWEVLPHRINQRIPLCGSSESMLIAFFKISRWRRRYSFSRCRRRISPAGSARGASLRPFGSAEAACATSPLPKALSRRAPRWQACQAYARQPTKCCRAHRAGLSEPAMLLVCWCPTSAVVSRRERPARLGHEGT